MRLHEVPPGFNADRVISMRIGFSGRQFATPQASNEFFRVISERIANVPGVTRSGSVTTLPFTDAVGWGSINVEGVPATARPGTAGRHPRRLARTISGRWRFR